MLEMKSENMEQNMTEQASKNFVEDQNDYVFVHNQKMASLKNYKRFMKNKHIFFSIIFS